MAKGRLCVFNKTRGSFLTLGLRVADTHLTRLVGLLGKRELRPDDGLWLIPCQGIHTIGMLFPIDVVYLDASCRVVHLVEHLNPFSISSIRRNSDSVMELPVRTIFQSQTEVGDEIIICSPSEMEQRIAVAEPEKGAAVNGSGSAVVEQQVVSPPGAAR